MGVVKVKSNHVLSIVRNDDEVFVSTLIWLAWICSLIAYSVFVASLPAPNASMIT